MRELRSLGERKIVAELLWPRYGGDTNSDFGDDCVVLHLDKTDSLVFTIDPCPNPMAWHLGFKDYYYLGWLLATINLSDIAAMGAKPLGLVTSLILPNETTEEDFIRLLDGLDDAANQAGTRVLGGNIKEANYISCEAAAIGKAKTSRLIRRVGALPRDLVVIIGDLGLFWAGVLCKKRSMGLPNHELDHLLRNVLKPRAKVAEGQIIAKLRLLSSGLDNSDGLYPSLKELAVRNCVNIIVDFSQAEWDPLVSKVASMLNVQAERLALGWGDWQLVGTVRPAKAAAIKDALGRVGTPVHIIGHVESGDGKVKLLINGRSGEMTPLDSERFSAKSWFTSGVETYIDDLLTRPLLLEDV